MTEQQIISANTTSVQTVDQSAALFTSLQKALESGTNPDALDKMLSMMERIQDRQSEQAYNLAMRDAESSMPAVERKAKNDHTGSNYAKLTHIQEKCMPVITAAGFSLSFGTGDSPIQDNVRIVCDVMHISGHTRTYSVDIPLDMTGPGGKQNKTATHGTASAITYGQRYLIALIFNINLSDQGLGKDDDGNAAGKHPEKTLTQTQLKKLNAEMNSANVDIPHFLEYFKIVQVSDLPQSRLKQALDMCAAKKRRMAS